VFVGSGVGVLVEVGVPLGVGVLLVVGVPLGMGVSVGTFGTQSVSPARIRVELPIQFAALSSDTATP